ncbi:hypothetical protein [Sulfitobacter sp. 1A12157]
MSSNEDSGKSLFVRITEKWKFSHWAGAITILLLWIAAGYKLVAYFLER